MTRAELARSILEREMSPAELDAKVREALADEDDNRAVRELIEWFTRRYPTAQEWLAYVRRRVRPLRARGHAPAFRKNDHR